MCNLFNPLHLTVHKFPSPLIPSQQFPEMHSVRTFYIMFALYQTKTLSSEDVKLEMLLSDTVIDKTIALAHNILIHKVRGEFENSL